MSSPSELPDAEPRARLPAPRDEGPIPLRLCVTRGALGIELGAPATLGVLRVDELSASLPGLRFPVDLSGGVRTFRHRRGELESLVVSAEIGALERWMSPKLRPLHGSSAAPPRIRLESDRLSLGACFEASALVVEALWCPVRDVARWVITGARAAGPIGPAFGAALRLVDTLFGGIVRRRGRVVELPEAAALLARRVLPPLGARAPAARGVNAGALERADDRLVVSFDRRHVDAAPSAEALSALELARLTEGADDALLRGDVDRAREAYLVALESAPRHPELCRVIAEIDLAAGGRAEAALGFLVEQLPLLQAGAVGAELLAAVGDRTGAASAFERVATTERHAPLAAAYFVRAAELADDPRERLASLDRAVACAPALAAPRWARFELRTARGDVAAARADALQLETAARGPRNKHAVLDRAARALFDAGYVGDAGKLWERSLRFVPDAPRATAGLARSLHEAGQPRRAIALYERALELAEARGERLDEARLALARAVADQLGDLPAAIARVREIAAGTASSLEARACEARWRSRLGDVPGASQAWARLRDELALGEQAPPGAEQWLLEAADFEQRELDDVASAERHLGVALRIAPRSARVTEAYRVAASALTARLARSRARAAEASVELPAPAEPARPIAPTQPAADTSRRVPSVPFDEAAASSA